jgi:hypothetical protein
LIEILYRSDTLEVRLRPAGDMRRQVVTFDCYHDEPGFNRAAFGEVYLAHHEIGAIHVLTHGNDWFQYADMADAMAAVRRALAGADRVLAYGSSMGGYGAIRFADAIGAQAVLALSPQYSVDRRKVPFERRWMQDQRRIRFRRDLDGPIRCGARVIAAYDPELPLDRQHVALIAAAIAIEDLALPHAGHPAGAFLSDVGLLKPLVEQLLENRLDFGAIAREAEARREQSPSWLGERSGALQSGPEAIALSERALALAPDSPPAHDQFARRLAASGEFERAVAAHLRAIELDVGRLMHGYRWNLSKTLAAAGDKAAALTVVQDLQQIAPHVAGHHRWAAELRMELGDNKGALADMKAAVREAPTNAGYHWTGVQLFVRTWIDRLFGRGQS